MEQPVVYENYFDRYTKLVSEKNIPEAFAGQDKPLNDFLEMVSEEKANYAYSAGKWTLKELLQHLIDAERVFCYRAMCISRKETVNLPGFNENEYAAHSDANRRSWADLGDEMRAIRAATKLLFRSFTDEMLKTKGSFNNMETQAGRLGFIIVGHTAHHMKVAAEKYF